VQGSNLTSRPLLLQRHALGQALHSIREGRADVVITVGADASITPARLRRILFLRASRLNSTIIGEGSRPSIGCGRFHHGRRRRDAHLGNRPRMQERKARVYAEIAG